MKNWEKEFDRVFVRDDGLINKYNWYGSDEGDLAPAPTPIGLKRFISKLLEEQKKELTKKKSKKEVYNVIIGEIYYKELKKGRPIIIHLKDSTVSISYRPLKIKSKL